MVVNEAIVAVTGQIFFRQYMRGKSHPYGIKDFVLADSKTGYVYRLRLYFGKETDIMQNSSLAQRTRVVLTLVEPLQGVGHHIITDRFYSSPELAKELEQRGLILTGTIQVNRRGMPLAVKSTSTSDRQLQREGESLPRWKGNGSAVEGQESDNYPHHFRLRGVRHGRF